MSRRKKIILLIVSCLLVIFLIVFFIMEPQVNTIVNSPINNEQLPSAENVAKIPITPTPKPVTPKPKADISITLRSLASTFTERYGSFSNQASYKNIKDLFPIMTAEFRTDRELYIKSRESVSSPTNLEYYGVNSLVINSKIDSLNKEETEAQLSLTVQRKEFKGSITEGSEVFYQTAIVVLKKEGGEWKVDSFEWK